MSEDLINTASRITCVPVNAIFLSDELAAEIISLRHSNPSFVMKCANSFVFFVSIFINQEHETTRMRDRRFWDKWGVLSSFVKVEIEVKMTLILHCVYESLYPKGMKWWEAGEKCII